jgi:hypothetical protein
MGIETHGSLDGVFGPGFEMDKPKELEDPFRRKADEEDPDEKEIRPSQVYETMEITQEGTLEFYDIDRRFLGRRPLTQREGIYNHIRKTKEVSSMDLHKKKGLVYVFWKNKDGEED